MKPVACCILSYEITKGMKSFGPIGLLKSSQNAKELILHQINNIKNEQQRDSHPRRSHCLRNNPIRKKQVKRNVKDSTSRSIK